MIARLWTTDTTSDTGGSDTVTGGADSDVILGGVNASRDVLSGVSRETTWHSAIDVVLGRRSRPIRV